jgi:S1-C subfamily serine protease
VSAGSGAANAHVRGATNNVIVAGESWPLGGDIIVGAGGIPTQSMSKLIDVIQGHKPGDTIPLVIYRGNSKKTIEVKLGRQPSSP